MSIDPKLVELAADVLKIFFIKYYRSLQPSPGPGGFVSSACHYGNRDKRAGCFQTNLPALCGRLRYSHLDSLPLMPIVGRWPLRRLISSVQRPLAVHGSIFFFFFARFPGCFLTFQLLPSNLISANTILNIFAIFLPFCEVS